MSKVFFISDLHLGHKNVLNFSKEYRGGNNVVEHSEWLVDQWNSVVTKRDTVWVLGDVCFDEEHATYLTKLAGNKRLILGNHDRNYKKWMWFLDPLSVQGAGTYKGFWVTHIPIHPSEMRGRRGNIHGHVHQNTIDDPLYHNVCVEVNYGVPILFDQIMADYAKRNNLY